MAERHNLRTGPQVHHMEAGAGGNSAHKAGDKAVLDPCMHKDQREPVQVQDSLHTGHLASGSDHQHRTEQEQVGYQRTEAVVPGLVLGTDSVLLLETPVPVVQHHFGKLGNLRCQSNRLVAAAAATKGGLLVAENRNDAE